MEEQAAVRLQAAGRGFLARRVARKMRMLLGSSLSYVFIHSASPIHPVAPIEVEVRVWGLSVQRMRNAVQQQASMAMAVSFVMAPALVLDKPKARVGWCTLHPSAHMKPADALFPWDPGETSITCRSELPWGYEGLEPWPPPNHHSSRASCLRRRGEMSWVGSTVHAMNSNRSRILGNIRLAWFVISLNLEIGFLRVKSGFLKGQVSPSI